VKERLAVRNIKMERRKIFIVAPLEIINGKKLLSVN
jgi:hypothetical protein